MKNYMFILFIGAFLFQGCRSNIPVRDTVPPIFNFHISGDGINLDINQNFDFDNKALYLKRDALYAIIYTASDGQALARASWEMPSRDIVLMFESEDDWITLATTPPELQITEWRGDPNNPVSAKYLAPSRFQALGTAPSGVIRNFSFTFSAVDYHSNTTTRTLIVRITNDDSHIGSRD
jgi:hypothetical protein